MQKKEDNTSVMQKKKLWYENLWPSESLCGWQITKTQKRMENTWILTVKVQTIDFGYLYG